jgi:hypothetical protein
MPLQATLNRDLPLAKFRQVNLCLEASPMEEDRSLPTIVEDLRKMLLPSDQDLEDRLYLIPTIHEATSKCHPKPVVARLLPDAA